MGSLEVWKEGVQYCRVGVESGPGCSLLGSPGRILERVSWSLMDRRGIVGWGEIRRDRGVGKGGAWKLS